MPHSQLKCTITSANERNSERRGHCLKLLTIFYQHSEDLNLQNGELNWSAHRRNHIENRMMSRRDKIQELDNKLKETLELCAEVSTAGIGKREDLKALAKPVLVWHEKWKSKERRRTLMYLSCVVAIIGLLYQSEMLSEIISAVAKIGMVKIVLPYWDWTGLHAKECTFQNPYQVRNEITEEQCEPLIGLQRVERMAGISQDSMTEDYLYPTIPVIVTDAMEEWNIIKDQDFGFDFIRMLYYNDSVLSNTSVCGFSGEEHSLLSFLDKLDDLDNFQEYWGHCKLPAAKVIRKFYQRPYFLPGMVEADTKNYLALGQRQEGEPLQFTVYYTQDMQMTWFAQVKGHFQFQLHPHHACSKKCSALEGRLDPGEILVFSNDMWQLQFSSAGGGESVALLSGGSWSD